jgi:hypothetical protein
MTNNQAVTGYMHPQYARSLAEFGIPRKLPRCRGWILQRQIPDFPHYDGMGCYPFLSVKTGPSSSPNCSPYRLN